MRYFTYTKIESLPSPAWTVCLYMYYIICTITPELPYELNTCCKPSRERASDHVSLFMYQGIIYIFVKLTIHSAQTGESPTSMYHVPWVYISFTRNVQELIYKGAFFLLRLYSVRAVCSLFSALVLGPRWCVWIGSGGPSR